MKKVSTLLVFCIFSYLLFAQKEGRMVIPLNGEWGVNHHDSNPPKTSWGTPVESTSEEIRQLLESRYASIFQNRSPRCLGSLYFIWASGWNLTPTWFSALIEKNTTIGINGETTAIADALQRSWTGVSPTQTAPVVTDIYINNTKPLGNNIRVNAGATFTGKVDATDRKSNMMTYVWEILKDTGNRSGGTVFTTKTYVNTMTASVAERGNYRLYVYVLDGTGRAGTANAPFQVQ